MKSRSWRVCPQCGKEGAKVLDTNFDEECPELTMVCRCNYTWTSRFNKFPEIVEECSECGVEGFVYISNGTVRTVEKCYACDMYKSDAEAYDANFERISRDAYIGHNCAERCLRLATDALRIMAKADFDLVRDGAMSMELCRIRDDMGLDDVLRQSSTLPVSYTPGPWKTGVNYDIESEANGDLVVRVDDDDDEEALAVILNVDGCAEPNASLIAMAPELLELLVAFHGVYSDDGRVMKPMSKAVWRYLKRIIEKAGGVL